MRLGGWDDAVALVADGSQSAFSGAVLRGKPVAAARALARAGKRDLELVTFTGSLEVELLLAAGALRTVVSSYVGLGPHGLARGFSGAVADGADGGPRALGVDARRRPAGRGDGTAVPAHPRRARIPARRGARLPHGPRPLHAATSSSPSRRSTPTSPSCTRGARTRKATFSSPGRPTISPTSTCSWRGQRGRRSCRWRRSSRRRWWRPSRSARSCSASRSTSSSRHPAAARPGSLPPLYHDDGAWLAEHRETLGADLLEREAVHV